MVINMKLFKKKTLRGFKSSFRKKGRSAIKGFSKFGGNTSRTVNREFALKRQASSGIRRRSVRNVQQYRGSMPQKGQPTMFLMIPYPPIQAANPKRRRITRANPWKVI